MFFSKMYLTQELSLLIVCSCVVYGSTVFATESYEAPPEILSEFETILEVNESHSVFCQGHKPLKWTVPKVKKNEESWTKFITTSEKPINNSFQYGSRLKIINMSYPFVGFYYCHYEDSDVDSEEGSAKIYLYVNDPIHLTTLGTGNAIEQLVVTQFQEAIIPCKPTSPDVKVSLTVLAGDTVEDTTYDPKIGFTFLVTDLSQQEIYLCTFSKNSESEDALVHLIFDDSLPVSHLPTPYIKDMSEGHTVIGNNLTLKCQINSKNKVFFHWETPNGPIDNQRMKTKEEKKHDGMQVSTLTIRNTTIADNGTYYCNVTDNQRHSSQNSLDVKIFGVNEYFLVVEEENDQYSLEASAGDSSVQWSLIVKGHPRPTIIWLNNHNQTIPLGNGSKYEASYNPSLDRAHLKIKHIDIHDFGWFALIATNNKTVRKDLFLNVTDKPTVILDVEPFYLINTATKVKCNASAYPEPQFQWYFKPCQSNTCDFVPLNSTLLATEGYQSTSEITINASSSGYLKCFARNSKGNSTDIKAFHVSDIKNGFNLYGLDTGVDVDEKHKLATIAKGDTVAITCGASKQNYSDITWFLNGRSLTNTDRYNLKKSSTQYSNKVELEIQRTNFSDSGLYSCRVVVDRSGKYMYLNMTFRVASPTPPQIINTTLQDLKEMDYPDKLVLFCKVTGVPKPTLTWYKNEGIFAPSDNRIVVSDDNEKIVFLRTKAEDEGTYKCEARNREGVKVKQQTVKFKNVAKTSIWLVLIIILLSLLSIGTIIFIVIKVRKEKRLQRELKLLGLANFVKGAVENINPDLGIDDQAELLPYDQKWEFPIDRLKLGKQLGSGAFGVVMKGVAKNIVDGEDETTVAVKMVKKNADQTYIKALASELKIMVHLGKHLNVVNLLGACTKNVAKRELLVIVEFCRFGNLQNYLLRHRDNYIDQIDPKSGRIDYIIGQEFFDRTYSVSSDRSNAHSPSLKYAALTFSNSGNQAVLPPSNNMGDYRANPNSDVCPTTDMTTVSQGEDGIILSNNSVQPEWRSNYKGDYKGNVKPICTKDLLAWAFQVARGMEYLASRKVLHGDLAARNILLADNSIVKICDFGLAKSMYKNDNYKKKGDGPLPVKWMAIESIRDRVFSTQSDVWSFGIVLWEFFSLARTPYPGMEADERLYQKLVDGYRMESPQFAPKEIYKMMTDCWSPKPLARPSFTELTERLGSLLEDTMRKHYIELNDPYLIMNTQRIKDGESDYLAMLSPPTFEALSSPHYVNEMVGQESLEDSGYLSMKPSTIFSPRVEEGSVFDFNVNNRKHLKSEDGNTTELLPMLRRTSDSGCETPLQSPTSPNSFSNPSYHIPPKIEEEDKKYSNNNSDILKSPDNYINMPQSKNFIKETVMNQNNPFVNSEKGTEHYVNSNSKDWESVKV